MDIFNYCPICGTRINNHFFKEDKPVLNELQNKICETEDYLHYEMNGYNFFTSVVPRLPVPEDYESNEQQNPDNDDWLPF